jgi:hypothetical protein
MEQVREALKKLNVFCMNAGVMQGSWPLSAVRDA